MSNQESVIGKVVLTDVKPFVADLAKRSLNTLWQTVLATAGVVWVASGLQVHDLVTIAGWHKLLTVVAAGILAAVLSAAKTLVVAYVGQNGAGLVKKIETDVVAAEVKSVPVVTAPVVVVDPQPVAVPAQNVTVTNPPVVNVPAVFVGPADLAPPTT